MDRVKFRTGTSSGFRTFASIRNLVISPLFMCILKLVGLSFTIEVDRVFHWLIIWERAVVSHYWRWLQIGLSNRCLFSSGFSIALRSPGRVTSLARRYFCAPWSVQYACILEEAGAQHHHRAGQDAGRRWGRRHPRSAGRRARVQRFFASTRRNHVQVIALLLSWSSFFVL